MKAQAFPVLVSKLAVLRKLRSSDVHKIMKLMNFNISKYLYEVSYPYSLEDARNFIQTAHHDFISNRGIHFGADYNGNTHRDISEFVGIISIKNIDLVEKRAMIGYWIGQQYWGKGIATECVRMTIKYALSNLGMKKLVAYVFPENAASIRVLEKNGMIMTGEISEYHVLSKKYKKSLVFKMNKSSD